MRVEALSARTPYGRVLANPDGTFTAEHTLVPTQVRRVDGSWVPADPTLVAGSGGWVPRAALVDVTMSNGGSGPFLVYRSAGERLELSWPLGALPVPVISGATARYPSVLPGVDLWVVVAADGFRPVLQVADAAAAANPALASVSYLVGGTLHGAAAGAGRVRFVDAADRTVFVTEPAVMWDSTVDTVSGQSSSGEAQVSTAAQAGDTARVADVAVSTSGSRLTLRPDVAMLTGPATRFPMFIDPAISPPQNKFAYADSANANNTTDKARVGLDPGDGRLYRSYFNFPSSQGGLTWRGKRIISAEFDIELYHSWACSDSQDDWVFASNVASIATTSTRMPWSGTGSRWLPGAGVTSAQGHANKDGGCGGVAQPDVLMRFGGAMKDQVQHVADQNGTVFAVGLCACNGDGTGESNTSRWKKYYIDTRAKLIVTFDTVPGVPVNLTTSGAACGSAIGTTAPTLSAQAVDADSDDTLSVTFRYQQLPSGAVITVPRPGIGPGNFATVGLTGLVDGATYQWQAQSTDASKYSSPVSPWCTFTIVTAPPPLPAVTSTGTPAYPGCTADAVASCTPSGGPGVAGSFILSPHGATDVTSFHYGWSTPPTSTVTVAAGRSATITATPPHYGLNTLYVSSSNGVKSSGVLPYQFLVDAPSQPLAYWPLDDINGHGLIDQINGVVLSADGLSWTPDARYIGVKSATINQGEAYAPVAGLDTGKSFSVAAWVRPAALLGHDMTAVGQDGVDGGGFYLGLLYRGNPAVPNWSFTMLDSSASSSAQVTAKDFHVLGAADIGQWTYLVGVYDAAEKTISLYVNGQLASRVARPATPWRATGPLSIGRGFYAGVQTNHYSGEVADVRVWNRVVTADDIGGTDADPGNGIPAQRGLMSPLQVASWDFEDTLDCGCVGFASDGSFFGRTLYLDPDWPSGDSGFTADELGLALQTNGVSGYASTTDPADGLARPVLRTDQSFSVSAWVKLEVDPASLPTVNSTVVAQDGASASAFYLGYNYAHLSKPGWSFKLAPTDTTPPTFSVTWFGTVDTNWTHLVGVYDAAAHTNKLYVNGVLVSTATGASPFQANGALKVGAALWRGTFADPFPGLIDDVQLWQGALSDREIADLDQNA
jgi:hypothetical protein